MRPALEVAALAAVLALSACGETPVSVCAPEIDPTCEAPPGPGDEVVGGVNLTALFAAPTPAEVDSARLDVPAVPTPASRTLTEAAPADGARRFVLALDDSLGRRVVTALVRVPGVAGETSPLPVVVVLPEPDDAGPDDLLTAPGFGPLLTGTVQVVVAYRGGALALESRQAGAANGPRASDLAADPYRSDVADVLAVVAALPGVPRADPSRLGVVGVGRGGTVALLAAPTLGARAVVTLGAPTDLFAASFVSDVRDLLAGRPVTTPYPALDALARPALEVRDGLALEDARRALVALSPSRLRLDLPPVLGLHADDDQVVGQDQLSALRRALSEGPGVGVLEVVEGTTHDGLRDQPRVQSQIASFLTNAL